MRLHKATEQLDSMDFVPTHEPNGSDEIESYFLIASTIYAYAAANGYDVYDLAERAKSTWQDPFAASKGVTGKPPLTSDGWKEWVRANY